VSATEIIEQIKRLPPNELAEVIKFTRQLSGQTKLNGRELTELARKMAETKDPAEAQKLKESIARGFYGEDRDA